GAAAGEVASQLAVDIIYEQMTAGETSQNRNELARRMVRAIEFAGGHIYQEARVDRSRRGMGTTATIAALLDRRIFLGQVGDSRAYLLRQGELRLLTRDQSLVNQLIEAGQLTEEEAETFEHNNIILQALGTSETVQVDLTYADLNQGDLLMLCSDGLSGMIRDADIRSILEKHQNPLDACRVLTEQANAPGGHDNITVIVVKVEDGAEPPDGRAFGYQKYALPELEETEPETEPQGATPAKPDADDVATISEEAANETRQLRVSHTMVGMKLPPELDDLIGEERTMRPPGFEKTTSEDSGAENTLPSGPISSPEPVEIPKDQVPPLVAVTIILSALALTGLLAYLSFN
ncbi:MAG: protein phosphatase 2C domain-containing protein, partial [Polyangiaceae bacterium]|nr:protein phosphatase 2C domain-containing protein [Polyangiaceae bacterium]